MLAVEFWLFTMYRRLVLTLVSVSTFVIGSLECILVTATRLSVRFQVARQDYEDQALRELTQRRMALCILAGADTFPPLGTGGFPLGHGSPWSVAQGAGVLWFRSCAGGNF